MADCPSPSAARLKGRKQDKGKHGGYHSTSREEEEAFTMHVNECLAGDDDLPMLPLDVADPDALFQAVKPGVLLCKLINMVIDDPKLHIDPRAINTGKKKKLDNFKSIENHNLAINTCINIGCRVVNIGALDLLEGTPHLIMGLLWQVIREGLLDDITLENNPELAVLLLEGETLEELMKLKPEAILLRWFNYHLANAGSSRRVNNFSGDLKDSECYTILMNQLDKKCDQSAMGEGDLRKRAEIMLQQADKIECRKLITPGQVVAGNPRLNLAFICNMFNTKNGLILEDEEVIELVKKELIEDPEEDDSDEREERNFRMWFTSLNIDRDINSLWDDIRDGMILLQSQDKIQPGIVDWSKTYAIPKEPIHCNVNCDFAVDNAKTMGCSIVNIGGKDICDGNRKLILGVSWQLMRLNIFQQMSKLKVHGKAVDESGVIAWANEEVGDRAPPIGSFNDKSLSNSVFLMHLIDAVRPETIDWDDVNTEASSEEEKKSNASYCLSMARKMGCKIFLTWEDVVEVQPKMMMTFLAELLVEKNAPSEEEKRAMLEDEEASEAIAAAEEQRKKHMYEATLKEANAKMAEDKSAAATAAAAEASTAYDLKVAQKDMAKANLGRNAKANKVVRKVPKGVLDLSNPEIEEAWQDVSSDLSETDWVAYSLTGDMKSLKVVDTGDDGIEGLLDEVNDSKIMFFYARVLMDDGRPKFVYISWCGPSAPEKAKGKVPELDSQMAAFMEPFHTKIMARDEDDIEEDAIKALLVRGGGAKY